MIDSDIDLLWGTDLVINSSGGIGTVSGIDKILQQTVRRFLTTSQVTDTLGRVQTIAEYYFHPDYGGSARTIIDNPEDDALIDALDQLFASQAAQVNGVALDPAPIIKITKIDVGLQMDATIYTGDGSLASTLNVRIS